MQLQEFIEKSIGKNTLIRLWYKVQGGHEMVIPEKVWMEWELIKTDFAWNEVMYVTDILVRGHYSEAINIVIKRK